MASPNNDEDSEADMDNPNMMFKGAWTRGFGPAQCLIFNDIITSTSSTNASMSWPFKQVDANVLDIIGGAQLSSGALITIQLDDFKTTIDTSIGTFPLAQGATDHDVGQCSYIATIGGIKSSTSHLLTITYRGPGKNAATGVAAVLTLSTLAWRQDPQTNNLTSLQLVASPTTSFPTSLLSSSPLTPTASASSMASAPSTVRSRTSHKTLDVAIGIAVGVISVIGLGIFIWFCLRRRKSNVKRVRRGNVLIPESTTSIVGLSTERMVSRKPIPQPIPARRDEDIVAPLPQTSQTPADTSQEQIQALRARVRQLEMEREPGHYLPDYETLSSRHGDDSENHPVVADLSPPVQRGKT